MNDSLKRLRWLVVAAVLFLGFLAYGWSLNYPYLADGYFLVEINPVVQRADLYEILTTDFWRYKATALGHSLYRPVSVASFAVEHELVGRPSALLSHSVNLFLHLATALLLFAYLRRIGAAARAASIAAMLFTVHPLLMEGVVNVVGRADVLATLLSVAALWTMTHAGSWNTGENPSPSGHRIAAWSTAVWVLLALGSKETAIALPFLIVGQEVLFRLNRRKRRWRFWIDRLATLAPIGIAGFLYLVARTLAIEAFPALQYVRPMNNVLVGMTGEPRVATTLSMFRRYVQLLVFPSSSSADYSGVAIAPESSLVSLPALGGILAVVVILVLLAAPKWYRGAGSRALSMGALLFLVPYLVIGNVLVLSGTGFAERLIYFSATGFCAIVAILLDLAATRLFGEGRRLPRVAQCVSAILLGGLAWLAGNHASMWRDAEVLAERSLEAEPTSLRPYLALAEIRRHSGRDDEALALYESALAHAPDFGPAWMHKGVLLAKKGRIDEAGVALARAVELLPQKGEPKMWLGLTLSRQGRLDESRRTLSRALLNDPGLVKAGAELGHVLYRLGRFGEAAAVYRGCIRVGREDLRPNLEQAERDAAKVPISRGP